MTDRTKFMEVVINNGKKMWEVAAGLGISPQALYNKLGNTSPFTAPELAKFRAMFPEVDSDTFNDIFFATELTSNANE